MLTFKTFKKYEALTLQKKPNSFIYSSFPNRGLIVILRIWDRIKQILPNASLKIFSNVHHAWCMENYKEEMEEIQQILKDKKEDSSIEYYGWVDKETLTRAWCESEYWLYPCKFAETFCLTALESALSKTCVITNDLAALQNTVGDRGFIIPGYNVLEDEWQNRLFSLLENIQNLQNEKQQLIQKNYEWAIEHTWSNRARIFSDTYLLPYLSRSQNILSSPARLLQLENTNPIEHKPDFIFNYKHKIHIEKLLYIGVGNANSIIQLLKNNIYYRNSTVTVLQNDIQLQTDFYRNIFQEGFLRCFEILNKNLYDMVLENKHYDCIILSPSHPIHQIQSIYLSYLLCKTNKYMIIYKHENTLPFIQDYVQQLSQKINILEENSQLIVLQKQS